MTETFLFAIILRRVRYNLMFKSILSLLARSTRNHTDRRGPARHASKKNLRRTFRNTRSLEAGKVFGMRAVHTCDSGPAIKCWDFLAITPGILNRLPSLVQLRIIRSKGAKSKPMLVALSWIWDVTILGGGGFGTVHKLRHCVIEIV